MPCYFRMRVRTGVFARFSTSPRNGPRQATTAMLCTKSATTVAGALAVWPLVVQQERTTPMTDDAIEHRRLDDIKIMLSPVLSAFASVRRGAVCTLNPAIDQLTYSKR